MSVILNRLKKSWENDCPEKICSCGNCQENNNESEPEFVLKENLSNEEIEEIIETEYKDKKYNELSYIRRALKLFGNKFSYHNTVFSTKDRRGIMSPEKIAVTCKEHGDFTVRKIDFFDIGCPNCFKENDNLIDSKLKRFVYKNYPKTRKYLVNQYINRSLPMNNIYTILKEDFIKMVSNIRDDSEMFDFSLLPDVLGENYESPIYIPFTYSNDKATISRIWKTNFYNFIVEKRLPIDVRNLKDTEEFACIVKAQLEEKHPYLDFSDFKYEREDVSITARCKIHDIDVTCCSVDRLLHKSSKYVCPECAKEYRKQLSDEGAFAHKNTEEFIKEVEDLYGEGRFDYSLTKYVRDNLPVILIDNDYNGEQFEVLPKNILRGYGNPYDHMSYGEILVLTSLKKIKKESISNLEIMFDKIITGEIEGRNTDEVRIDFICKYGLSEIWIEYNGEQHYNPRYYRCMNKGNLEAGNTAYKNQLKRDKNVEEYCYNNNIQLLVIPYTYKDVGSVYDVLYKILVEGKDQKEVIIPVEVKEI